ncbi:putative DHA14-like major facilitator ABC transporter protein [Rutstroemia sp. NJR-2017a WRK4]|nr:putative DHA14-like major facilitator ABC transporter protein [Rutstroemia sp. NJR-2017a WRK4]
MDTSAPPLPSGKRLALIIFFACIALLLQALDTTIVSTAIPAITDDFNTTADVGWYGSAYFLTQCAFQIFWGRLYTFYDLKTMYVLAIGIFEVGSLLCAVAPTSSAFIVGRAFAGVGAGGVFTGSFISVAFSVPLQKRPMYAGILGTVYGVASVLGPPIGGAFTTNLSWRGCFYMNLPLGAIVVAGLIPFFPSPQAAARLASLPSKEKIKRMDPLGTVILVMAITCLLLALQWGGLKYSWSNARIIVLFVISGISMIAYIIWQIYLGPVATIPKNIITQRSMSFATFYSFTQGGVNFGILYYAPVWFQVVKGHSALHSGLDIVSFSAGMTVTMLATGYILTKGGYSMPFMVLCVVMVSVACGLLTTWTPSSSDATVFGYLTLYGLGQGFGWQQPILIAQTMLPAAEVPTGTSLTTVCKLLGGTIFVSVAESLYSSKMRDLFIERLPQLDPGLLASEGSVELREKVGKVLLPTLISCYNDALKQVWWLLLGLSAASLIGALGIEWRSVTDKVASGPPPQAAKLASSTNDDLQRLKDPMPMDMRSKDHLPDIELAQVREREF